MGPSGLPLVKFSSLENAPTLAKLAFKGLFGWAVAVKKVAVGCELWKKLL